MARGPNDEPVWLIAAVDQRLADFGVHGPPDSLREKFDIVAMTLTDPPANATPDQLEVWDKECDNCKTYHPLDILTSKVFRQFRGSRIILTVGLCQDCAKLP